MDRKRGMRSDKIEPPDHNAIRARRAALTGIPQTATPFVCTLFPSRQPANRTTEISSEAP